MSISDCVIRLGERKRIFAGWEQRNRVVYKGKELTGYFCLTRKKGQLVKTTHFNGRSVDGHDFFWLARRNSLTIKLPENYAQPMERVAA